MAENTHVKTENVQVNCISPDDYVLILKCYFWYHHLFLLTYMIQDWFVQPSLQSLPSNTLIEKETHVDSLGRPKTFNNLFIFIIQVEDILSTSRYLTGDTITEADVRLFTTLVRFDMVYVGHFKVLQN